LPSYPSVRSGHSFLGWKSKRMAPRMFGSTKMNLKMPDYIAGTCNIGVGEIRRRQLVAILGSVFSVVTLVGLIAAHAPYGARFTIFAPLMVASTGWVQSRKKFCLAFGFMGTFNFGSLGSIARVSDPASRAQDRATAIRILLQSLAIAIVLTLIVGVLPF